MVRAERVLPAPPKPGVVQLVPDAKLPNGRSPLASVLAKLEPQSSRMRTKGPLRLAVSGELEAGNLPFGLVTVKLESRSEGIARTTSGAEGRPAITPPFACA